MAPFHPAIKGYCLVRQRTGFLENFIIVSAIAEVGFHTHVTSPLLELDGNIPGVRLAPAGHVRREE
jgi:hypothetical protein